MSHHKYSALDQLVGRQLSSVEFVQDYFQLRFDGPTINVLTSTQVSSPSASAEAGQSCFRDLLCERIAHKVIAVSIVPGTALRIEFGDILDIPYPDGYFDAYISMGVVEHFEGGPLPPLKEAHRVLKPGGLIFVSTPTVNVLRRIVRQPIRKAANAVPTSLLILKGGWSTSKLGAVRAAMGPLLPERLLQAITGRRAAQNSFLEYRFTKSELQRFLRQSGFDVLATVPHDFLGSRRHGAGLAVDFPHYLAARGGVNFRLNPVGTLINAALNGISPWVACSSVLCVGRAIKKDAQPR